jgi:hypothetical protein
MSDAPMQEDGQPDDASFGMSEDGRTLEVKRKTKNGVLAITTRWAFIPTPELIYKAIHGTAKLRELEPGQKTLARRFGRVIVIVNTGPPTWWLPRPQIGLGHDRRFIRGGWFNIAVSVSGSNRSSKRASS